MNTTMNPIHPTETEVRTKRQTPKKSQAKRKKAAQKKKQKQKRIRAAISINDNITYLHKDPTRKHHFVPSNPQDIARQVSPKSRKNKRSGQDYPLDKVDLGKRESKKARKLLKKSSQKQWREAHRTLCSVPDIFPDTKTGWKFMLLCMLALVLDLAVPDLPGVPVILLENVAEIPKPLLTILEIFRGPTTLKKHGAKLKRPSYLHAYIPIGRLSPSVQMEDYLGGHIKVGGKKKFLWAPLSRIVFAISPNTPESVRKTVTASSPLAVPVFCGNPKIQDRPLIKIDGTAFQQYDPAMLKKLKSYSKLIFAELSKFSRWIHQGKKRWKLCATEVEKFIPTVKNGRFIAVSVSPEITIIATALAVFRMFLEYAVEEKWVKRKKAHNLLYEVQTQLLPESIPQASNVDSASPAGSWDDPATFWAFLQSYLQAHQQKISLSGAPCSRDTATVIHQLPDGKFLILPREQLVAAYAAQLNKQGIGLPPVDEKKWGTQLQRTIMNWGVQLKTEGKDTTWRFTFYKKDVSAEKCKVPCLAFPLAQLPESIRESLTNWFGAEFEAWIAPQTVRNEAEAEKVLGNVEDMGNEQEKA